MNEDCYIPFGYFAPGRALSFAISLVHRRRPGLLLKLISSALMRWAASADRYFDIEVAGIRLRSNFSDNYSERKFVFLHGGTMFGSLTTFVRICRKMVFSSI